MTETLFELPVFRGKTEGVTAYRRTAPFSCKIDGMTLQGLAMDWEVFRMDGSSYPLHDHLFRILFEPVNPEAEQAFNKTYELGVGLTEKVSMVDKIMRKLRN